MSKRNLTLVFKMLQHLKYNKIEFTTDKFKLHLYVINAFGYFQIL